MNSKEYAGKATNNNTCYNRSVDIARKQSSITGDNEVYAKNKCEYINNREYVGYQLFHIITAFNLSAHSETSLFGSQQQFVGNSLPSGVQSILLQSLRPE